jgi:transposase
VRTYVRYLNQGRADTERAAPLPRRLVSWIMTRPVDLLEHDREHLDELLAACPHLTRLAEHVHTFATLLTERRGDEVEGWMTAVETTNLPALHGFVRGLRKDLAAVTAGLSMPYSNGPAEGVINKIKLLKRQMYGRAGFALLRQRILLS